MQSRYWCFTLNNPTGDEIDKLKAEIVDYRVFGDEVGESGTPHIQGYMVFPSNKRLAALKKISPRAHWETARGNPQQASDYCKKDGKFEETGELPASRGKAGGEATMARFKRAREQAISGELAEIDADLLTKYYRTYKQMRLDSGARPDSLGDVCGIWYWGPAGSGKTRRAWSEYPDAYDKAQNKWWDGYTGQEAVILDDLDSAALHHLLKRWADFPAFNAETKGGAMMIRPKVFVVTSNSSPAQLFKDMRPVDVDAISRRFKVIHIPIPPTSSTDLFSLFHDNT